MSENMSYQPTETEMANIQSEANDINKMVDEGLLTPKEAEAFEYGKEIESPEALLSKAPELSDRLREHVISKFPAENFLPENIDGTLIHGTNIRAIRPIWLAEGKQRTYEGRKYGESSQSFSTNRIESSKGKFAIHGDFTRLGEDGFDHINRLGERNPGFDALPCMPIYLVLGRTFRERGREEQVHPFEVAYLENRHPKIYGPGNEQIKAVVLTKPETLSIKTKAEQGDMHAVKIIERSGEEDLYQVNNESLYLSIKQEVNYIAHCMVQGIDKSAIVPIYDWDGKLLWPTADDVAKDENERETGQETEVEQVEV